MSRAKTLEKGIKKAVAQFVEDESPGVAVLLLEGGEPVHCKGYGLADLDGTEITPQSVFDLASVSKHITATAINLLAQQGKINVEDDVKTYLPNFTMKAMGREIRVQDLIWHIAGLPDYSGDAWDGSDDEFANLTTGDHVLWLSKQKPLRAPGKKYEYNNSGYALLAAIVEEVSGEYYSTFVDQNLFAPLGMSHTLAFDDLELELENRVTGYTRNGKKLEETYVPSVIQGDGNIFTTLEDLILWDQALRNHTLLNKSSLKKAWSAGLFDDESPVVDSPDGYEYGYGWSIDSDTASVFHSGSWSGTATYYVRFLDYDSSLILLSNDDTMDVASLAEAIGKAQEEADE